MTGIYIYVYYVYIIIICVHVCVLVMMLDGRAHRDINHINDCECAM